MSSLLMAHVGSLVARSGLSWRLVTGGKRVNSREASRAPRAAPRKQVSEAWNEVSELLVRGTPRPRFSCLLRPGLWDGEEAL